MPASRPIPTKRDLRRFGLVLCVPFGLLAGLSFWKSGWMYPYLAGLSVFFLVFGLLAPGILRPIEKAWMALAHRLSIVSTFILLTLTYILAITPMGFLVRLFRKDLLGLRPKPPEDSYWVPVDPDGPTSRHDKPF